MAQSCHGPKSRYNRLLYARLVLRVRLGGECAVGLLW